jgi:hypothetical protein
MRALSGTGKLQAGDTEIAVDYTLWVEGGGKRHGVVHSDWSDWPVIVAAWFSKTPFTLELTAQQHLPLGIRKMELVEGYLQFDAPPLPISTKGAGESVEEGIRFRMCTPGYPRGIAFERR